MIIEQSGVITAPMLCYRNIPTVITTAVGQMAISKGRQGREAQNIVRVYVANLRLKEVTTDVLITAYEPIHINPLSESATAVGAGFAVPAAQCFAVPAAQCKRLRRGKRLGVQLLQGLLLGKATKAQKMYLYISISII